MSGRPNNEMRIMKMLKDYPSGFTAADASIILNLTSN